MTDTVLVVGPALAGAGAVAAALRSRLDGCMTVEPVDLAEGRIPDVVVFVTSAAAPMSDCDAALFAAATGRTDAVVAAVTKIDVHRTWRAVLDANRTALRHPVRARPVPWVGVAADPDVGPMVIGPLIDAVRAELADGHRHRRNLLRTREWTLARRIAGHDPAAARRAALRARAARRGTVVAAARRARIQLAGEARARCAALRADVQREAATASRRGLDSLHARAHRRAQQIAEDFDAAVANRMVQVSAAAGTAVPELPATQPVGGCLPPPRGTGQEDRLAAVLGTAFGLGVALTVGRFLAEVVPGATPATVPICLGVGLLLAGWVVRTRRLVTARAGMERWATEVAAAVRIALEDRVLAAESALLAAFPDGPGRDDLLVSAAAGPTVDEWIDELARVRAALGEGVGGNPGFGRPELGNNPD